LFWVGLKLRIDNNVIEIDIDLSRPRLIPIKGKDNKGREIIWHLRVRSISNYVFHDNGERLYYVKVQRAFKRALTRAKIEDFHFHDLRHTFASKCVHAGIDLYAVQKLLGHKDGRMTQRYAHLSSDYLRDAVAKLNKTTTILLQPEVKESAESL